MKQFTVKKQEDGMRLNRWLEKTAPRLGGSLMYRFLRTKNIKVNGARAEASDKLHAGDIITTYISDDFFVSDRPEFRFLAACSTITVIYEDSEIALLYKPAGVAVHDEESGTADTLVNRFIRYLYEKGEFNPEADGCFVPALCNRLDTGTFGIVIAAKTRAALAEMNEIIRERLIDKRYLTASFGNPQRGRYTAYLKKDEKRKLVSIKDTPAAGFREIITDITPLKKCGELTLSEVGLITGRTHQIRAHMAHLGWPILGDGKYGIGEKNRAYNIKRQALCAYKLHFELGGGSFPRLSHLDGKTFEIKDIWFREQFFG